jgi:lipopolysaccharide export LptBFGC system permease protein LptF
MNSLEIICLTICLIHSCLSCNTKDSTSIPSNRNFDSCKTTNDSTFKYAQQIQANNFLFEFNDPCNNEILAQIKVKKLNGAIAFGLTNQANSNEERFISGFGLLMNGSEYNFIGNFNDLIWRSVSYAQEGDTTLIKFTIPFCNYKGAVNFPKNTVAFYAIDPPMNTTNFRPDTIQIRDLDNLINNGLCTKAS